MNRLRSTFLVSASLFSLIAHDISAVRGAGKGEAAHAGPADSADALPRTRSVPPLMPTVGPSSLTDTKDEIHFFNVGQGHATLVRKFGRSESTGQPYAPLLIDAGSRMHPFEMGAKYLWDKVDEKFLSEKIVKQILRFWGESYEDGDIRGKNVFLNIIVTHPDEDHIGCISTVLATLKAAVRKLGIVTINTPLLLGGEARMYEGVKTCKSCKKKFKDGCRDCEERREMLNSPLRKYSSELEEKFLWTPSSISPKFTERDIFDDLQVSGCITLLFCPKGIPSDTNRWSIVTRIEIVGMSVMITGDADSTAKAQMFKLLATPQSAYLQSDILLIPHHGAEKTYHEVWDLAVNPRAIVIGAGMDGRCDHPKGATIVEYLKPGVQLWEAPVKPHAILYFGDDVVHTAIGRHLTTGNRMFDQVPSPQEDASNRWYLIWTDIPIYTLWTTGTLVFSENVALPQFVDAPNGLMGYVAVSPEYYFSPGQRPQEPMIPLIKALLQDGEGNPDDLRDTVLSFPSSHVEGTERVSINLTENLELYQNRVSILRVFWDIPLERRAEILGYLKELTLGVVRNFSVKERIIRTLLMMDQARDYIDFLRGTFLLTLEDALATAATLEVFSKMHLDYARDIYDIFCPHIYPNLRDLSAEERNSILEVVKVLLNIEREEGTRILKAARSLILPHQRAKDPRLNFYDETENAKLVEIFNGISEEDIPSFKIALEESIKIMTEDANTGLYPENRFIFKRALLRIPARNRPSFLAGTLPLMHRVCALTYENWEVAALVESLANVYSEESYPRIQAYIGEKLASHYIRNRGNEWVSPTIKRWIKDAIPVPPFSNTSDHNTDSTP